MQPISNHSRMPLKRSGILVWQKTIILTKQGHIGKMGGQGFARIFEKIKHKIKV
jgi:hypothetical protein